MTISLEFERFMNEVWTCDASPVDDGGILLTGSPLYDAWHNAVETAKLKFNAVRVSSSVMRDGEWFYYFSFPDRSRALIAQHGGAVKNLGLKAKYLKRNAYLLPA